MLRLTAGEKGPVDVVNIMHPVEVERSPRYQKVIELIQHPPFLERLNLDLLSDYDKAQMCLWGYRRNELRIVEYDDEVLHRRSKETMELIDSWSEEVKQQGEQRKANYVQDCIGQLLFGNAYFGYFDKILNVFKTHVVLEVEPADVIWSCAVLQIASQSHGYNDTNFIKSLDELAEKSLALSNEEIIEEALDIDRAIMSVKSAAAIKLLSLPNSVQPLECTEHILQAILDELDTYEQVWSPAKYAELLFMAKVLLAQKITVDEIKGEPIFGIKRTKTASESFNPPETALY